jgi:hypothetical protein
MLGWAPVQDFAGPDFTLTWTIPEELLPKQGQGGGPTRPAHCYFTMNPPYRFADFEITP